MKKALLFLIFLSFIITIKAQQNVGVGTRSPDPSAQLDLSDTSKGFLAPRMTYAQRNLIANPAKGLMLYCLDCGTGELQGYNGTKWTNMIGGDAQLPLAVGVRFGGGTIGYIFQPGDPGYVANQIHGIIVALENRPGTNENGDPCDCAQWTCTLTPNNTNCDPVYGVGGTAADTPAIYQIGRGLINTDGIIQKYSNCGFLDRIDYAAKLARDYNGAGYTDWFLPSLNELIKVTNSLQSNGTFGSNYYWSSSEMDQDIAWAVKDGYQNERVKVTGDPVSVRPVRYF